MLHRIFRVPSNSINVTVGYIKVPDTVFLLSSPLILLTPQLFIPALINDRHKTDYSKRDNVKYIFNYKLPSKVKDRWRKFTIPIGKNKLFAMRTSNGYKPFLKRASTYDSEWSNFSGAFHKILEDGNNEPPYNKPR